MRGLIDRMDEAVRVVELRRYQRILAAGRLPFVYALGVFMIAWLLVPIFFGERGVLSGPQPYSSIRGWGSGVYFTLSAVAAMVAAYLRSQALWHQERQLRTLHAWLLTRQSPARVAWSTVLMAALLGLGLGALPAGVALVMLLVSRPQPLQVLLELLLLPLCAFLGAGLGAAAFFISYRLAPRGLQYGALLLGSALFLGLWLRIEQVENGWRRPWEEHPARIGRAMQLVTPGPALLGAASPQWWNREMRPALGGGVTAIQWSALYAGLLLLAGTAAAHLAARGYRALADDPDRIEPKPRETLEEGGTEYYWKGFRNPVLTRDIRTRLRSKETAEFIFFASIAVAAGGFVPLVMTASDLSDPLQTARAARQVFFWLTMTLVALVTLVAPGLTADVIARERAGGGLEMLIASALRPRDILTGRLLGAVSVLLLLISPSLPLFGLCYLFHGASAGQVTAVYLLLMITVVVSSFIGITQSAIHGKAGMAKFWAYAITALFVGLPGGPFWCAAWAAAPAADMRQSLGMQGMYSGIIAVFWIFPLVLFGGNACEQLEYSEY